MNLSNLKQKLTPHITKTISHTVQGYIFGTMVGLITNKETNNRKFFNGVNNTAIKFAKVGFVYSTIDSMAEGVYGRTKYNSIATGALTGLIVGNNKVASTVGLGVYSALVDYYNPKE